MIFTKDVTIGILTYKRNILLERLLTSLCSNIAQIGGANIPVVIVDNSAEATSYELIETFKDAKEISISFVNSKERQTIPQGRNNILENTHTDWLLMLDDDQWIREHFLSDLTKALSTLDLAQYPVVKLGIQTIDLEGNTENLISRDIPFEHHAEFDGVNCASGGVILDMRIVKDQSMKFDNKWTNGGEDNAFFYQFQEYGKKCLSLKDLKVYEVVIESRQGFCESLKTNMGKGYTSSCLETRLFHTSVFKIITKTLKNIIVLSLKLIYCFVLKQSKVKKIACSIFYQLGKLRGLTGWEINIYNK